MMMVIEMKRSIYNDLIKWKNSNNRKPLMITGVRQCGKTFIIREFAKNEYLDYIEINLEKDLKLNKELSKTHDPKEILDILKLSFMGKNFDDKMLVFFDEIQACPDLITALKFLKEDFPSDIICSGSLLGVALSKTTSFPVGYIDRLAMYPMSFKEFLWALNIDEAILEKIKEAIKTQIPLSSVLHDRLNELFKRYVVVGGMPEVIKTYLENNSFSESLKIQRRLVEDYLPDMVKYSSNSEAEKIAECFSSIPLQLAKENQKFQYSIVKKGYNARYYDNSLRWLEDAGMIIKVHRLAKIEKPLKAYLELAVFKVFMLDSGLLVSQLEDSDIKQLLNEGMTTYKGAIYENIVAQTLRSKGKRFYYFEPSQHSEIDFVMEHNGKICPIEVKSSLNTASRALSNFIAKYDPDIAIRLSKKNFGKDEVRNVFFLPLYAMEFLLEMEEKLI